MTQKKSSPNSEKNEQPHRSQTPKPKRKLSTPPINTFAIGLLLMFAIPFGIYWLNKQTDRENIKQSEFEILLKDSKIKSILIELNVSTGNRRITGTLKDETQKPFQTEVTYSEALDAMIREHCSDYDTRVNSNLWNNFLFSFIPVILLVVLIYFLFSRQIRNAGRGALQFGKSRAKISQQLERVTFADVAGINEAKEDVEEIVDYLKNPDKFYSLGGKIPKGILMVGPPGAGKTLLARAIAGEADVPFFNISGSDFVEMFVGIGASRVRDMFEQGRKQAPCIIFIDEIDAVGRSRFSGIGGGHDEREQTLNALLVEMDGFEAKTSTIVLAATNRPDVLDKALLRPGRFDRQITVDLPDLQGRLDILKVHAQKVNLNDSVKLESIAKGTPGFSGADLANLINEAALLAARSNKNSIEIHDLEEARDKICWGKERRSRKIDEADRKITAYHEAGHALVALHCKHSTPLHKVTIIPRGNAFLGAAMRLPERDKYTQTQSELMDELTVLMGGRYAEKIIFNEVTSGAAMDIKQASELARKMVCEWGMSKTLGMINFSNREEHIYLGRDITRSQEHSEQTSREIDLEVKDIITQVEDRAEQILKKHKQQLKILGEELLKRENMDVGEIKSLLGMKKKEEIAKANNEEAKSSTEKVEPSKEHSQHLLLESESVA